jgi:oligoendopeptidase, M3 family
MTCKFNDYKYERPDLDAVRETIAKLTAAMRNAKTFEEAMAVVREESAFSKRLMTMSTLAEIRFTLNTEDPFYKAEQEFFDEASPVISALSLEFAKALTETPFRAQLAERYGQQMFTNAELNVKRMSPALVPFMQEENRLCSEYQALAASCKVEFNGEVCNNYGLLKYMESPDRDVRKAAFEAWAGFFVENEAKLDEIYDKLVHLRHKMANAMGYDTFTPLGYLNMGRTDYDAEDVARFRAQVVEHIVPACVELRRRQAERIGVEKLHYYDESYAFTDGNAAPVGDRDFMVGCAQKMYRELSKETGEFFDFMVEHELLELETRPNKAVGGYCTFIPDYDSPFIFSNFNGTSADVDVLTHEAGHAFEAFCASRNQELPEYYFSTSEVNEIHSMSMEFFAYPWMELFFGAQAPKYRFSHMADALQFIPYGACVDEYQHIVYANPDLTPAERTAAWKELEKKYLPDRSYDGNAFMEKGGFWMQKLHIFLYPFYYIDYTLASMGAFEFYGKMQEDHAAAWADYYRLCCAGGSQPYLALLKLANLSNPFAEGSVARAIAPILKTLSETDDRAL